MKLCVFNKYPSLYREEIYTLIDKEYDCDWFFMDGKPIVEVFDSNKLNRVKHLHVSNFGPFYWISGLIPLLKKKEYDVYFFLGETGNVSLFLFLLLKKCLYRHKRVYLWTHGFYGKESKLSMTFWKKPLYRMPDGLFPYGEYSKQIMINLGFDQKRIFPIHNSLAYSKQIELRRNIEKSDIYQKHFGNALPVIVFIGRLTEVKKLDMLLDAIGLLKKKGHLFNLVFVGDGIKRKDLEEQAENLGIINHVWFYGACYDEKQNAELIFNADLCVAPGNIGLTAIHSLMFGCPAMSHNDFKWQMPEFEAIKEGKTGTFFEANNVESLADRIQRWFLENGEKREFVRQACFEEIDNNWTPQFQIDVLKKHLL